MWLVGSHRCPHDWHSKGWSHVTVAVILLMLLLLVVLPLRILLLLWSMPVSSVLLVFPPCFIFVCAHRSRWSSLSLVGLCISSRVLIVLVRLLGWVHLYQRVVAAQVGSTLALLSSSRWAAPEGIGKWLLLGLLASFTFRLLSIGVILFHLAKVSRSLGEHRLGAYIVVNYGV